MVSRREQIREYIQTRERVTMAELSEVFTGCSSMTLWRDLKTLEEGGYIRRFHGGAEAIAEQGSVVGAYSIREKTNKSAKKQIAKIASEMVLTTQSTYFDTGSTLMALAECMENKHYTIITCGANIAIQLAKLTNSSVIAVGGQINQTTLSFTGTIAESIIDSLNIDTAFMSASGFSIESGFTNSNLSEYQIKKKVIAKARRCVMLVDISKQDTVYPFTVADWSDIDCLIVDQNLPDEYLPCIKENNIELFVASDILRDSIER